MARPREYDDSDSERTDDAVTIIPEWEYDNMETGVILETTIDNLEGNQDSRKVVHWGILEKLISFKYDSHYYCLVSKLTPLDTQICTDTVTNAKFNDHFIVCQPPRYTLKLLSSNCYKISPLF